MEGRLSIKRLGTTCLVAAAWFFVAVLMAVGLRLLRQWLGSVFGEPGQDVALESASLVLQFALPLALLAGVIVGLVRAAIPKPGSIVGLMVLDGLLTTAAFLGLGWWAWARAADPAFARDTVILAWAVALLALWAGLLAQRYEQTRRRIIYNQATQLVVDLSLFAVAFLMAYLTRFDGLPPVRFQRQMLVLIPYVAVLFVAVGYVRGIYRFVWRYVGLREALVIAQAVAASSVIMMVTSVLVFHWWRYPRIPFGVVVTHFMFSLAAVLGVRVLRRLQHRYLESREELSLPVQKKRLLLLGAGQAAELVVRDLEGRPEFELVGFLDDDPHKKKRTIHGLRVLGNTRDLDRVATDYRVDQIVLCIATAPQNLAVRVVATAQKLGLTAMSVPRFSELVSRKISVTRLKPISMEDLLGRDSIQFPSGDRDLIDNYHGKRILVTGAAGSIGSELARQLRDFQPSSLLLLDKDENGLFEINLEISEGFEGEVVPVVADIRDRGRLKRILDRWKPQVLFHAAAYKHVPMMELWPSEAILNNVVGSRNLVQLAAELGVESFVLISTDKAVNPTNVMGASKRVAEMILQEQSSRTNSTHFCCVRFGNVLGSRASVVPLFQKRIREGKNLTVTHPEIVRFFMTIPEAVQLVIQAGSLGRNGEIFVLDMGDPVKIVDLARWLIELSGLTPGKDIEIEFSGLRPGEKLYEELMVGDEQGVRNTTYSKIFVLQAVRKEWDSLHDRVAALEAAARQDSNQDIYESLKSLDLGYHQVESQK